MKPFLTIAICLLQLAAVAQTIQVIVPDAPVVKGTAFQVQYVITQPQNFISASTPLFDSCRIVSGPAFYKGNAVVQGKLQPIQNITYTLVPQQSGLLRMGSLLARFKDEEISSGVLNVTIVEPPKASYRATSSATTIALLASGNNFEKLVKENLFLKTIVSKKLCYVGEAIVATFKLYSRLQSTSEALNAPSFYGFAVADMLPINEAHTRVEVVNGKVYNTAILRQVQLFPQQAGRLTIDPLQVESEVELDDSIHHQKMQLKQALFSEAVAIDVLPLPEKAPDDYNGAVGDFQLSVRLNNNTLKTDEEGRLVVRINGAGNFIQFGSPQINWPQGIEVLNETSNERLNKHALPMSGIREFVYEFSAAKAGRFVLPSLFFSYFDVRKKQFVRLATQPLQLMVTAAPHSKPKMAIDLHSSKKGMWVLLSLLGICVLTFMFFFARKRKVAVQVVAPIISEPDYLKQLRSLDLSILTEKETCSKLQKILSQILKDKVQQLNLSQKESIQKIMDECSEKAYAPFSSQADVNRLVERSKALCATIS